MDKMDKIDQEIKSVNNGKFGICGFYVRFVCRFCVHRLPRLIKSVLTVCVTALTIITTFLYSSFPFSLLSIFVVDNNLEDNASRGMVICAGPKLLHDAAAIIYQTRIVFKSSLPIAIMHCDELNNDDEIFLQTHKNVTIMNICKGQGQFGMNYEQTKHRFHSWFCKPAALYLSPFQHTMVADTDVVFFKKPDLLFTAPKYKQTGALFFRDRFIFSVRDGNEKIRQELFEPYLENTALQLFGTKLVSIEYVCTGIKYNSIAMWQGKWVILIVCTGNGCCCNICILTLTGPTNDGSHALPTRRELFLAQYHRPKHTCAGWVSRVEYRTSG